LTLKNLLIELNRVGAKLRLEGDDLRISAPAGALTDALKQGLRLHKAALIEMLRHGAVPEAAQSVADPAHAHEPFPLTELQQAYWLGRSSAMSMGGVSTHVYMEFDGQALDMPRLNDALVRLIAQQGALRLVVRRDGQQQVLETVPAYVIRVADHRAGSSASAEAAIQATRDELSHQVCDPASWPLFDIRATLQPEGRTRLHLSFDMLVVDARSLSMLLKDWWMLYDQPALEAAPPPFTFRDYVMAERQWRDGAAYRRATDYWMRRVDAIPAAPALPVVTVPGGNATPRFARREATLDKARWQQLKSQARGWGLTPTGLLLAVYADVLSRWSGSPHFTLNLTVGDRLPVHPGVQGLLGPFTSVLLHEVDRREGASFREFAQRLQKRFSDDYDHRQMCGVGLLREWTRRHQVQMQGAMPVVFSSSLFGDGHDPVDAVRFGRRVFALTQSSQVWLDSHVMEVHGDLVFNWDAVDAMFAPGVLDAMFASYAAAIERLADDAAQAESTDLVTLPQAMLTNRRNLEVSPALGQVPSRRLHAPFVAQALQEPGTTAVVAAGRTLSRGELLAEAVALAEWLLARGVKAGQPVAVITRKGWEQVVAVYGVLLAGGAYMPIDADLPLQRQLELLGIGEVSLIVTQADGLRAELSAGGREQLVLQPGAPAVTALGAAVAASLDGDAGQMAYVIFTSGTTGTPKGVMIDHRGAINTLRHVNALFGVTAGDRALAVSSLSFDLSVYDLFGVLGAGGALVLPDARKGHDPAHWEALIAEHRVTVWNSAPQLMQMLVDSSQAVDESGRALPLRRVLLSGDFIPLDLPARVRARAPGAEVISLGGATEASVWSNYYRVAEVCAGWASIPYGKALPEQTIRVLDWALRPCPDHVRGRIYIGGIGLAMGYWKDAHKTAASFINHPATGERLYDTGDLGRYAADGHIVILGRDDGQVKIRGHRIELGEIEAVLCGHPLVKQALVLPTQERSERRQLVAYIERTADSGAALDKDAVRAYLGERLPEYMVPRHVLMLDRLPVTGNGKIDYRRLPAVDEETNPLARIAPRNPIEAMVFDAWKKVFKDHEFGVTENFFELGGDSVTATMLLRELNAVAPASLEMHQFFERPTVAELAAFYADPSRSANGPAGAASRQGGRIESTVAADLLQADIQARSAEFDDFDFSPRGDAGATAVLVTGATGWVGSHMVAELLVRGEGDAGARQRFLARVASHGVELPAGWADRVVVWSADMTEHRFGLTGVQWRELAESVHAIYHFAASLTLTRGYASHSAVNVGALPSLVEIATRHHLKPIYTLSPMTVSRRNIDGVMTILASESAHAQAEGLLTSYAQSKWVAEQVLMAANARGLPVRIYRSSHALPSARSGQAKAHDTYNTVLKVACGLGVVPDWNESRIPGLPVDVLCRLMADDTAVASAFSGVVNVENQQPQNFKGLLAGLLARDGEAAPVVPLDEWKQLCVAAVDARQDLDLEEVALIRLLFGNRTVGKAVDNIFSAHQFETSYFQRRGWAAKLADLTPLAYWARVSRTAGWLHAEAPALEATA
jgi:pyochelin synthetase